MLSQYNKLLSAARSDQSRDTWNNSCVGFSRHIDRLYPQRELINVICADGKIPLSTDGNLSIEPKTLTQEAYTQSTQYDE